LLDPTGIRHDRYLIPPGRGHRQRVDDALARMRLLAQVRSQAALPRLCQEDLPAEERDRLLRLDPVNTNLRFLEAIEAVRQASPDIVVLTGDVTDDGRGYELVLHGLRDYIADGRLVAVAGNHDLSAVPPGTSANMPLVEKNSRWSAFRVAAGLGVEQRGAAAHVIDDVFLLGLNSSVRPTKLIWSARGLVGRSQLSVAAHLLRQAPKAKAQLCLLHHHVAHLRLGPIARADPGQFAMKLRDARQVMALLAEHDFTAVLNGHRHHGYYVHEANLPHVVSSPSTTLGCRASGERFFWRLSVDSEVFRADRHYFGQPSPPASR
jgi:3',5'-cyclic AMP phosphodiesterase CpdA